MSTHELFSNPPGVSHCCHQCHRDTGGKRLERMILCSECGNKRCPKATDHALTCTGSNDTCQSGSVYA